MTKNNGREDVTSIIHSFIIDKILLDKIIIINKI